MTRYAVESFSCDIEFFSYCIAVDASCRMRTLVLRDRQGLMTELQVPFADIDFGKGVIAASGVIEPKEGRDRMTI